MNRFLLSFRAFWDVLTNQERAERVQLALDPPKQEGPDLRILALLQRDGRLIDFLQEEIELYSDEQIGSAVRNIHAGCRKALTEYLKVEAIVPGQEDDTVTIPADFDPAAVRLIGNVSGSGPYQGTLKHHGWRVASASLPSIPPTKDETIVLEPAEVDLS